MKMLACILNVVGIVLYTIVFLNLVDLVEMSEAYKLMILIGECLMCCGVSLATERKDK